MLFYNGSLKSCRKDFCAIEGVGGVVCLFSKIKILE